MVAGALPYSVQQRVDHPFMTHFIREASSLQSRPSGGLWTHSSRLPRSERVKFGAHWKQDDRPKQRDITGGSRDPGCAVMNRSFKTSKSCGLSRTLCLETRCPSGTCESHTGRLTQLKQMGSRPGSHQARFLERLKHPRK